MARAITSIPEDWVAKIDQRITALRRPSVSHHLFILIEDDLRQAGLIEAETSPALQEYIAKVQAAAAASPRIIQRLEAALRRELRPQKTAA